MSFPTILSPNASVTKKVNLTLIFGWLAAVAAFWVVSPFPAIPQFGRVATAFAHEWQAGSAWQLVVSLFLSFEAIAWASVIGLGLCYLSTIPVFKPFVRAIGSLRFLSLAGLTLIFLSVSSGHTLKVSVLAFTIITFLINDMLQVIEDIPSADFDHARSTGLNRWQVLYDVVIRGTLADAFEAIRMNAAMAWMMLTVVESLSRSEGGIGVLLMSLGKAYNVPAIFAVQLMIFVVGLGQDYLIKAIKAVVCPYTRS
jgi:NitT/TauT family transport system permease protein